MLISCSYILNLLIKIALTAIVKYSLTITASVRAKAVS